MNIYVASSCKNTIEVPYLIQNLRRRLSTGTVIYNFLAPAPGVSGFLWNSVDPDHASWTHWAWLQAMKSTQANAGYDRNFRAMRDADLCIVLLPCGRSAHLEAGWCAGQGKTLFIYGPVVKHETAFPMWNQDLMYKLADGLFTDQTVLTQAIRDLPAYAVVAQPDPEEHITDRGQSRSC